MNFIWILAYVKSARMAHDSLNLQLVLPRLVSQDFHLYRNPSALKRASSNITVRCLRTNWWRDLNGSFVKNNRCSHLWRLPGEAVEFRSISYGWIRDSGSWWFRESIVRFSSYNMRCRPFCPFMLWIHKVASSYEAIAHAAVQQLQLVLKQTFSNPLHEALGDFLHQFRSNLPKYCLLAGVFTPFMVSLMIACLGLLYISYVIWKPGLTYASYVAKFSRTNETFF